MGTCWNVLPCQACLVEARVLLNAHVSLGAFRVLFLDQHHPVVHYIPAPAALKHLLMGRLRMGCDVLVDTGLATFETQLKW